MTIEKVHIDPPLTISKLDLEEIIKKVKKIKVNWKYTNKKEDKDYWAITVSPDGEIIYPNEKTPGHPAMAEYLIYPYDELLKLLFNYFYPKKSDNNLAMSYFMILYGYISIDGFTDTNTVNCKYNSNALTYQTRALPDSMKLYAKMEDFDSIDSNDTRGIAFARKVPWFKDELIKALKQKNPKANINEAICAMTKKELKKLLDEINNRYLNEIQCEYT